MEPIKGALGSPPAEAIPKEMDKGTLTWASDEMGKHVAKEKVIVVHFVLLHSQPQRERTGGCWKASYGL